MPSTLIISKYNTIPCHMEGDASFCLSDALNWGRQVADMEWVALTAPSMVQPGQVFTITLKYKFVTRLTRSTSYLVDPIDLNNWLGYHGAYRRCTRQAIGCVLHTYWIWRFDGMSVYHNGNLIRTHTSRACEDGKEWTYTWTGTIEQLTGRTFSKDETVSGSFSTNGKVKGLWGAEWWPWEWPIDQEWTQDGIPWTSIFYNIQVHVPPTPWIKFDTTRCSVSKSTVQPTELFDIRVRIVNTNDGSGPYTIKALCQSKEQVLGSGQIGPYAYTDLTFTLNANQLAQREITESTYLSYTVIAVNGDGAETDYWNPPNLAVIVTDGEERATLTGVVKDGTGAALAAVRVAVLNKSTTTNVSGYYSLVELPVGTYTVSFSKSGYDTVTKSKTLVAGLNTLNVTMYPTGTSPEPSETPWLPIVIGAACAVPIILAITKDDKRKQER